MSKLTEQEQKHVTKIGHRMFMLRNHNRLSQAQMAEILNCPQAYVSEWERGKRMITMNIAYRACAAFGLSMTFFDPKTENFEKMFEPLDETKEKVNRKDILPDMPIPEHLKKKKG